jgi:hypothetical protein
MKQLAARVLRSDQLARKSSKTLTKHREYIELLYPKCRYKKGSLAYPVPYRGCLLCGLRKLRSEGDLTHPFLCLVGKSL